MRSRDELLAKIDHAKAYGANDEICFVLKELLEQLNSLELRIRFLENDIRSLKHRKQDIV